MATLHKFTGEEIIATELPSLLNQNFEYVDDNRIKTVNNVGYDSNNNINVTHLVTQSIQSGTDLNNLKTSGEYIRLGSVTKLLNSPSESPFFLTVLSSNNLVKQVLTELIASNPTTFTRTMNSANWSPWIESGAKIATQAEAEGGTNNTKMMTPKGVDYRLKKDRQVVTFSSLESLGLSPSTATPKAIVEAMPPTSYLSFYASSSTSGQLESLGLPQSSFVIVESGLNDTIPTSFRAYPLLNTQQKYFLVGHYKAYNDFGFTGWTKVLTEEAIATQSQAEAGTDNATVMTPLRTKQLGDKNYLPLTGGVVSGQILLNKIGQNIMNVSTDGFTQISGGYNNSTGANLLLFGKGYAYSTFGAGFELRTATLEDGSYKTLRGKDDGTLIWNHDPIITQTALNSQRPLKTFTALSQLGLGYDAGIDDIATAMPDDSVLCFAATASAYPNLGLPSDGNIEVQKRSITGGLRFLLSHSNNNGVNLWMGRYASWMTNPFSGWKKLSSNGALSMPSIANKISVTFTKSGETYTAPTDGWLCACVVGTPATITDKYLALRNGRLVSREFHYQTYDITMHAYIPMAKGDVATIEWSNGTFSYAEFFPAKSEV